jgi:hypothetical protein
MQKIIEIIKIGFGLVLAYIFVIIVGNILFLNNTPQINMQYIASLREIPSYVGTQLASLSTMFENKDALIQNNVAQLEKQTGATEIPISSDEQKTMVDSVAQTTNSAPNAIFNYVSQGVAASAPDTNGQVILRFDPKTQQNIEYKRFKRPDGTYIDIMILK